MPFWIERSSFGSPWRDHLSQQNRGGEGVPALCVTVGGANGRGKATKFTKRSGPAATSEGVLGIHRMMQPVVTLQLGIRLSDSAFIHQEVDQIHTSEQPPR